LNELIMPIIGKGLHDVKPGWGRGLPNFAPWAGTPWTGIPWPTAYRTV